MKRKFDAIDLPELPDEIISEILSFVPYEGTNWLDCRLVCKKWLSLCVKAQDPSTNENRLIVWASENKRFDLVRFFLKDKRVSATNSIVLQKAVVYNQQDIVKTLLSRPGTNINIPALPNFPGPISCALNELAPDSALELLADPRFHLITKKQHPIPLWMVYEKHPLEVSVECNYWKLIKPILDHPEMKEKDVGSYSELLTRAARNNSWMAIRLLFKYTDADPSITNRDPFYVAVKHGYIESLKELLKHRNANLEYEHIRKASENGHTQIVAFILNNTKLMDNSEPYHLIDQAASNGKKDTVRFLLHALPLDDYQEENEDYFRESYYPYSEIMIEILERLDLFEKFAAEKAIMACNRGDIQVAKDLMNHPKFKATPEQMQNINNSIAQFSILMES